MSKTRSSIIVGLGVLAMLPRLGPRRRPTGRRRPRSTTIRQGYYKAGAFDLAIQEFLQGYKLDLRAGVLFNIARGYEELKDKQHAIEFYKKYVDLGAAAAASTEARARMVVLERQIKEEDERKKAEAAEAERKRQEALNPPPVMPAPVETKGPGAAPAAPPPAPGATPSGPEGAVSVASEPPMSPETARKLRIAGMATGGATPKVLWEAKTGAGFASVASPRARSTARSVRRWPGPRARRQELRHGIGQQAGAGSFIAGGVACRWRGPLLPRDDQGPRRGRRASDADADGGPWFVGLAADRAILSYARILGGLREASWGTCCPCSCRRTCRGSRRPFA
jgi:hypothetical protein